MNLKVFTAIIFILLTGFVFAIDEDELPFGFWGGLKSITPASCDTVADSLGANIVHAGGNGTQVRMMQEAGITVIPATYYPDSTRIFHQSLYVRWEAKDDGLQLSFDHEYGDYGEDADSIYYIVHLDSVSENGDTVLSNLKYLNPSKYSDPDLGD